MVNRYVLIDPSDDDQDDLMELHPEGEYVTWNDYERLQSKLGELRMSLQEIAYGTCPEGDVVYYTAEECREVAKEALSDG